MALIVKARSGGDLGERSIRQGNFAAGAFDAKLAQVLADRAMEVFAPGASQVDRMHTNGFGDSCKGEIFGELIVEQVFRLP